LFGHFDATTLDGLRTVGYICIQLDLPYFRRHGMPSSIDIAPQSNSQISRRTKLWGA
jgi:hypothetical protein